MKEDNSAIYFCIIAIISIASIFIIDYILWKNGVFIYLK